jgi:DNA-directed RNA polymerase beta' subunit
MAFIYKNLFKSLSLAGGFMRVGPPQIRKLPIKTGSEVQNKTLMKLVEKIISLNNRLNEIFNKKTDEYIKIENELERIDSEIDDLVYKIYGINESEKKIIEENIK